MAPRANLIRPSDLARFWGLHPKTLYLWVRAGKLDAVRTPGGQFRVDPDAVRDLAREHDLPVPPFVGATKRQVTLIGGAPPWLDALRRRLRNEGLELRRFDDPYEGLVATVLSPPQAVVLLPDGDGFDVLRAARSLRRCEGAKRTHIVVADSRPDTSTRSRRFGVDACVAGDAEQVARELLGGRAAGRDGRERARARGEAG